MSTKTGLINIGNKCVFCMEDTSAGSGKFVNRIGADSLWFVEASNGERFSVNVDGYMCEDCQTLECSECNDMTTQYEYSANGDVICTECVAPVDHRWCDYTCDSPAHY